MSWHGQVNRTLWEIRESVNKDPDNLRYRRELLRANFLQRFEFDKALHVPRDDRSFLFLQDGESTACLLLHGAQGTPAEMRELGNYLYTRGLSVYCPRLSRTDAKDRMVSWESWVTRAETALDTVITYAPKSTFVVGLSLGGTIGMVLSHTKGLKGLVLLAPALIPRSTIRNRFYQVARMITPTLFYRVAGWSGEVLKAMDYTRKHTKSISIPVLALQASDDRHLSHRGIKFLRRHAQEQDSDFRVLAHGTHVLTRGPAKGEVYEQVHAFLDKQA